MASKLDQVVKGAAPPSLSVTDVKTRESTLEPESNETDSIYGSPSDPTAILPSSPPQIYLNLLILEASLRSQYLTLRARRRQNMFFLFILCLWNAFFFYALFLRPREDGIGIGGSVYWVVETTEKVALMGGIVTGMLIWGTGQWERGVRWPRRFVGITNRGLRTMNCKIVVTKDRWWKEYLGKLKCLLPFSSYYISRGSSYHYIETADRRLHHGTKHASVLSYQEEDLAPGGDAIKLLLLPKPFSPDFRENWESYRSEYWDRENSRRAELRRRLGKQLRQRAREKAGWMWWLGLKRSKLVPLQDPDLEKSHARHAPEKESKKPPLKRSETHSRNTSRSSTPASFDGEERPPSRGSRSGVNEGRRRPRGSSAAKKGTSRLSGAALERSAPMPMSMATQARGSTDS